jgi:hypothetical protein
MAFVGCGFVVYDQLKMDFWYMYDNTIGGGIFSNIGSADDFLFHLKVAMYLFVSIICSVPIEQCLY